MSVGLCFFTFEFNNRNGDAGVREGHIGGDGADPSPCKATAVVGVCWVCTHGSVVDESGVVGHERHPRSN